MVQRGYKTKPKSQLAHSCENCNRLYPTRFNAFPFRRLDVCNSHKDNRLITVHRRCPLHYNGTSACNGVIFVYTLGPFERITRLLCWKTVDLTCRFSRCWLVLERTQHNIDAACLTVYFSVTFSIEMSSHQHVAIVSVVCSTTGGQVHAVAVCR